MDMLNWSEINVNKLQLQERERERELQLMDDAFHYSPLVSLLSKKQAQPVKQWWCCSFSCAPCVTVVHVRIKKKKTFWVFWGFIFCSLDPFTSDPPCFVLRRESSVWRGRRGNGGRSPAGRPCGWRSGARSRSPGAARSREWAARSPPSSWRFRRATSSRRTS